MAFLEIENLSKTFNTITAVDSFSVSIDKGEILGILGPSGCGKTTILKLILGLLAPTSGNIRLEGKTILDIPPELRNFGYIPQNLALFPHLNVFENIAFGLKARKWQKSHITTRINFLLDLLEITHLQNQFPHEISGGQQQRVALARALAPKPSLLLMDEPLSSLDTTLSFYLRWEMRKILKNTNSTAIFVTHDPEEAISVCDRLVLMDAGQVIQTSSSKEILRFPTSIKVMQIMGKSNLFPIIDRVKDSNGTVLLETSLGTLIQPQMTIDTPIFGFWIPERDISISDSNPDPQNNLDVTGELLGIIWGRIKHRLIFQLPDNNQISVQVSSTQGTLPKIGERVTLIISRDKIKWF
jgi:ABC-type Fe3+/spermidine/putrescine transport system ATPase subunit